MRLSQGLTQAARSVTMAGGTLATKLVVPSVKHLVTTPGQKPGRPPARISGASPVPETLLGGKPRKDVMC
jgi:hypothetical protein